MKFCPNCKGSLVKNPKHAESVWQCSMCQGVFFILVTTKPSIDVSLQQVVKAELLRCEGCGCVLSGMPVDLCHDCREQSA